MTKPNELKVIRNYNYSISIEDSKGRRLQFRDICGKDLEFLESIISPEGQEEPKQLSFDEVIKILDLITLDGFDFKNLPQRLSIKIFELVKEHILLNYMPKYAWLGRCYGIQNGSFSGVSNMEEIPMTKFMAMVQIHKDAIESINKDAG